VWQKLLQKSPNSSVLAKPRTDPHGGGNSIWGIGFGALALTVLESKADDSGNSGGSDSSGDPKEITVYGNRIRNPTPVVTCQSSACGSPSPRPQPGGGGGNSTPPPAKMPWRVQCALNWISQSSNSSANLSYMGTNSVYQDNNPGNILYGDFSKKYGATPGVKVRDATFARFPNIGMGLQAGHDLMKIYQTGNLKVTTVVTAQNIWNQSFDISNPATPAQVTTANQITSSWQAAGFTGDTQFSKLTDAQLTDFLMANAVSAEGFFPPGCTP
jgi:hypothetical protein